ncbi:zinc finger FYVE domain-containing protein 16 isoform X1 [Pungitius pungitius]|uniref:zinc finger FYVE domain-containing protein 16 isoform X1 n=1 Tax=Pungitius pungitius TaxID=134920 RepID=UPI002E114785
MDSFFKAAVCDLDKLLDDFELNTEEHECKSVFLKPSVYPFSSLGSQCLTSEASKVPPTLPDLNALHYGSAPGCPHRLTSQNCSAGDDPEVKVQPLTAVDLLSSVDRGPAQSSAPPCPDRALKPVCDLVNDTSSAVLLRADSHEAFSQLDVAEKQMTEEEEEEEEVDTLLVDFESPVVTGEASRGGLGDDGLLGSVAAERTAGFSASLSLLDVILPAVAERSCEPAEDSPSPRSAESAGKEETRREEAACTDQVVGRASGRGEPEARLRDGVEEATTQAKAASQGSSGEGEAQSFVGSNPDSAPGGLSCLPIAVSICGALLKAAAAEDESRRADEPRQEAAGDAPENPDCTPPSEATSRLEDPVEDAQRRASPEGRLAASAPVDPASCERSEPSPVDPPQFGFEYLPESEQAELLVTDEELEAFLQAHAEAEQRGASLSGGLEGRLGAEEPSICGGEGVEDLASPESDRTMPGEGGLNHGAPSQNSDGPPCQEEPELPLTSNSFQPQHGGPDQPPAYGGARPKQLHCQTARSPATGEEGGEEPAGTLGEDGEDGSPSSLPEEYSNIRDLSPMCPSQEPRDHSVGCDELSEPPPYPGDSPSDGEGTAAWKTEGAEELGTRQPAWMPDSEAPNCMNCTQRFTFTKRRHHCRACGKVYCAVCCNRKCKLKYLEKEARVCVVCFDTIHRAQALERMMSPAGPSPNPNVPSEYCSTIPPLQQARAAGTLNSPPPTVMVPVSVLKHPNNDSCPREQKRVWFADGILPNGEVADTSRLSVPSRRSSQEFGPAAPDPTAPVSEVEVGGSSSAPEAPLEAEAVRPPPSGPWDYALLCGVGGSVTRVPSLLPDNEEDLPPLLISTGEEEEAADVLVEESPAPCQILHLLEEGGPRPLTFVLNANLLVNVKLVTYSGRRCWCLGSSGLQALGQKELVFLLECLPEEKSLPKDLFTLYLNIYQEAQKGKFLEELDNVTFTSSFLGSKDHAGMLFFSPSCQPLDGLSLPPPPFMFGLLVQKLEVPWAKVFPLRLLLRLGAEYSVYPTTLTSVRFRDSVYRETGHTIMNLLADLRNYQYSLSVVEGLRIHMEMGHSYIDIPKSSFNEMQKVVNAANEHVISIGARFSSEADSHLVCFQSEEGSYQTQASSKPGQTRTVTGASFVVFNGALKASSGFIAKSSIVEDGLMVQIPPETMEALRGALREQTDFHIPCGRNDGGEPRENVSVRWVDRSSPVNAGRSSAVDGRPLDGVRSVRMQQEAEFESDGRTIRCTEVFYQPRAPEAAPSSCGVFQKEMALAACSALTPHLAVLAASGINALSLRVSTQADMVEYQAGSGGRLLPQRYMNELDGALIPVIHGGGASVPQTAMDMEFVFYITHAI